MKFESRCEKSNIMDFEQVRHKLSCTVTEDGKKLESLDFESRGVSPIHVVQSVFFLNEPLHKKTNKMLGRKQRHRSASQYREADLRLVFATRIVQSLFFLNPKFQASNHLLWLHRSVCVGPGLNPKLLIFSCSSSNQNFKLLALV